MNNATAFVLFFFMFFFSCKSENNITPLSNEFNEDTIVNIVNRSLKISRSLNLNKKVRKMKVYDYSIQNGSLRSKNSTSGSNFSVINLRSKLGNKEDLRDVNLIFHKSQKLVGTFKYHNDEKNWVSVFLHEDKFESFLKMLEMEALYKNFYLIEDGIGYKYAYLRLFNDKVYSIKKDSI